MDGDCDVMACFSQNRPFSRIDCGKARKCLWGSLEQDFHPDHLRLQARALHMGVWDYVSIIQPPREGGLDVLVEKAVLSVRFCHI